MPVSKKRKQFVERLNRKRKEEELPVVAFVKWLFFTVGAAYLLLFAKFIIGRMFEELTFSAIDYMGEIMFAVVMISAEALHVLFRVKTLNGSFEQLLRLLVFVFSVVGIFISTLIFAVLLTPTGSSMDISIAKTIAMGLITMSFLSGAFMQIYNSIDNARKVDA